MQTPQSATTATPAPARDTKEDEAERLYKMARQAERFGQRPAAVSMYRKIARDFAGTSYATKAAERLKALGQ